MNIKRFYRSLVAGSTTLALIACNGSDTEEGLRPPVSQIDFGDNGSLFANDGQCDDRRFGGDGMIRMFMLDEDVGHDATDCRNAYDDGDLVVIDETAIRPPFKKLERIDGIEFGDDDGFWANDGECDDIRFEGKGSIYSNYDDTSAHHIGHDATDCHKAYSAKKVRLRDHEPVVGINYKTLSSDELDFGDDTGGFAYDDECDDPRFTGDGMAYEPEDENTHRDAADCRGMYIMGTVQLK